MGHASQSGNPPAGVCARISLARRVQRPGAALLSLNKCSASPRTRAGHQPPRSDAVPPRARAVPPSLEAVGPVSGGAPARRVGVPGHALTSAIPRSVVSHARFARNYQLHLSRLVKSVSGTMLRVYFYSDFLDRQDLSCVDFDCNDKSTAEDIRSQITINGFSTSTEMASEESNWSFCTRYGFATELSV